MHYTNVCLFSPQRILVILLIWPDTLHHSMIFHFPCSWLFGHFYFTSSLQNIFDCACCHWYHSYFWKDQTLALLQHWVSDCALYDGGSGWVVLQIRRRRRGQQLINNPGDRLIAVPRTSSTRYPCTNPVPVYLVPCTSYPAPCTAYSCTSPSTPMYPATHDGSRYSSHWILTLSSLVGQRLRIIESIRQLPRHSGQ